MSQIITVTTQIKNFKPLQRAYENLGYKKTNGDENQFTIQSGRLSLTIAKDGEFYSVRGDSDYMGYNRGSQSSTSIKELETEYAKEETLAWAKFEGRTVTVKGSASKGYDIEVSG